MCAKAYYNIMYLCMTYVIFLISFINILLQFRNRVQHILEIKDEKCLSLYRKLIRDLENYSEKIFILQASLEEVTEEETDSSEVITYNNCLKSL